MAAREQALQLDDIGRMGAELDRGGQRDGNQSGVLTGIEKEQDAEELIEEVKDILD